MNNNEFYLQDPKNIHLEKIFVWRNKSYIRDLMFNNSRITWEDHVNWFNNIKEDDHNQLKIFSESGKARGVVQFNNINLESRTAEWGFYIGDPYKKGLGIMLALTALNHAFNVLNLRKVTAQVLSTNNVSIQFHKKIGFIQEGVLKRQIIRHENLVDVHFFAQFCEQWNINKKLLKDDFNDEKY